MKKRKVLSVCSAGFVILSALSLLYVSILAFISPQQVMDLVNVSLDNTDAISSVRGIYGGVGLTIVISLLYSVKSNLVKALGFLSMLWGFYALSRLITLVADGPLGAFGTQWLCIESMFFVIAVILLGLNRGRV